jgi:hypothetical protein
MRSQFVTAYCPRIVSHLFCRMKSDLPARWFRRRRKERQEFLVNVSQSRVVFQQRLIDLGKLLQNRRIRRQFFPLLDKRANDIDADSRSPDRSVASPGHQCSPSNGVPARRIHRDGTFASQDVGGLECAVFGKGPWPVSLTSALSRCGRKLRPHG